MVFDRTWKQLRGSNKAELSQEEHLEAVLEAMADHPFLISSPDMARQVAEFAEYTWHEDPDHDPFVSELNKAAAMLEPG